MNAAGPTQTESQSTGARPAGAYGEREAAAQVREMFDGIAPRYDFLNHFLSFQLDRLWRRRVVRRFRPVLERPGACVLDLCCGTGDLAFALSVRAQASVFGADFSHPMLVRALQKSSRLAGANGSHAPRAFLQADALSMPFAAGSFDLITVSFGFRNLANYDRGLREMFRVLRPGGQIGILEFAEPSGAFFRRLYRFYFHRVLPRVGNTISGSRTAYGYLPVSVGQFPSPTELKGRIINAGFVEVNSELWTAGTLALHRATKP
ncbi:MAG TPA: bifunctional demethylmenaquinone methyltransferase/2-methoxy-6-polyprenyl-1,4-benzoquinol methylase UbiE [Candidatus Acidoferrum sp.]|nr:bifunctional demethylmenaquinone methyltransferase/2-methoxy-6-polyprenyl-1,4-benzoquinol methylase UbiE [Candidatus Acidoferrum sp.]